MVKQFVTGAAIAVAVTATAFAQQTATATSDIDEQLRARQRIAMMEASLERAVSMGAIPVIRQVQDLVGDSPRLLGVPRVTGTRLEGIGVIFNVQVPALNVPILWEMRHVVDTRATNAMLAELRMFARQQPPGPQRANLDSFIARLEAQNAAPPVDRLRQNVSAASLASSLAPETSQPVAPAAPPPGGDSATLNPDEVYRNGIKAALIDAMLESSASLAIGPNEWLIVSARRDAPRDPLFPADFIDTTTWVARVKGSDLEAFRTQRITAADVRKLVQESDQ
jgi:hypothetical protein